MNHQFKSLTLSAGKAALIAILLLGSAFVIPSSAFNQLNAPNVGSFFVDPTSGLITNEPNLPDTFDITFTCDEIETPNADIIIELSSSDPSEGTVQADVTFTSSECGVTKIITVSGVDDDIVDGDVPYTIITNNTSSADENYDGLDVSDVSVTNVDDETAGITVTEIDGTNVTEDGDTDTYAIVLDEEPSDTVTINITPDADTTVISPTTLTFLTSNWDTPQDIQVGAFDDAIVEGPHTGTITNVASDGGYDGVTAFVTANITDNDNPSVTISESDDHTDVTEGDTIGDTYDVVLDAEPSATVTISIITDDQTTVNDSTEVDLEFTTTNWSDAQSVTVKAVDDAIVEVSPHTSTITHSATGGGYTGVSINSVVANITDNDDPSVNITESGGITDVTEGGATDTYDVVLDAEPSATVTVSIVTDDQTTVNDSTEVDLDFTTANWSDAQTVTVKAVDDAIVEVSPHTSTITHSASGSGYDGVAIDDVIVDITDNDDPGISITESGGSTDVTEGGSFDTYNVALSEKPSGPVTITLFTDDGETTTNLTSLSFNPSNWDTLKPVEVTAVDDDVAEGSHIGLISHVATGGGYGGLTVDLMVNITDNDAVGALAGDADNLLTTEGGGSITFTLQLSSQPSNDVTITLNTDDVTEGIVDPTTEELIFTPGNWDQPQDVTVNGEDDNLADGSIDYHVGLAATSSDENYNGLNIPEFVTITNQDNDTAGVTANPGNPALYTTEKGGATQFTVVLNTRPLADVTIPIQSLDDTEGLTNLSEIVFTPENWDEPVTVIVTGQDDGLNDDTVSYKIKLGPAQSSGVDYDGTPVFEGIKLTKEIEVFNDDDEGIEIKWVEPVVDELEIYEAKLFDWPITLRVEKENPAEIKEIDRVRFYRWDAIAGAHKTLFVDLDPPFEYIITDPEELNIGFNQIFADSYDMENDSSDSITFFIRRWDNVLLPMLLR